MSKCALAAFVIHSFLFVVVAAVQDLNSCHIIEDVNSAYEHMSRRALHTFSIAKKETQTSSDRQSPETRPDESSTMRKRQDRQSVNEDDVGGGAINEKARKSLTSRSTTSQSTLDVISRQSNFDPTETRAHLQHALEGLDRYPNYLSRWNSDEDISSLESALEKQLETVRRQKQEILERREGIKALVHRACQDSHDVDWSILLHPPTTWENIKEKVLQQDAARAIFRSEMFQNKDRGKATRTDLPSVDDVLNGKVKVELDASQLEAWLDQETLDVYSFPLLSEEFCHKLTAIVRKISSIGETPEFCHLNVGRRPIDLDTIGVTWINDLLMNLIIRPLSRHLFQDTETLDDLDWRQGYIVGYSADPSARTGAQRQRLVSHTDDSEVTLNLCIGCTFEGGTLRFMGLRGSNEEGKLVGQLQPRLGTALLHVGRHLHGMTEVTAGDRYALVVWTRSWKGVRAKSCPCCWLNRRQGNTCICGPRWN